VAHAPGCPQPTQRVHGPAQVGHEQAEQAFALGRGGARGVAEDAVRADVPDAAGAQVRHDLAQRPGVAGRGGIKPHVIGGERQHDRRLHPPRVRVGHQGFRRPEHGGAQAGVPAAAAASLIGQQLERVADRGRVAAVAVDEEHRRPVEGRVPTQLDQQSRQSDTADRQGAGEIGVLAAGPDRDRRRERHPGAPRARPDRDGGGDPGIGVERQMRPMLLKRPDRHHQQPSRPRLNLRPARGAQHASSGCR
jgi:hypothetical protein